MRSNEEYERLIEKFADGNSTNDEAQEVIDWFKEPGYHLKLYQPANRLWDKENAINEDLGKTADLDSTLDRLHHRINIYREQEESGLRKRNRFYKVLSRAAAILFIPLLVTSLLYIYKNLNQAKGEQLFTEINATFGSKLRTQLPDGSVVWLNSGSTLKYPQTFSKKNRQATLSGEAYFEITSDRLHPFVINTDVLDLRVLGTKFNVNAYPEENQVSVTLEQGKIAIEKPGISKKTSQVCFLEPGEHGVFQKGSGAMSKVLTKTDKYTSWKDGKLIFRNDPLALVIKRLERWYNTDIDIAGDEQLPETPYTLTIEDETITQVLEYLSLASPISWEVIPAHKLGNGNISRTRYIISNKKLSP
jgi:transmembrane sensor